MVASHTPSIADSSRAAPPARQPRAAAAPPASDEPPLLDLGQFLRESPPWLISAIVHMLAVIVLGLIFVQSTMDKDLLLNLGYSEDFGDPIAEELDLATEEIQIDDQQILTPENLPLVEDPLATPNIAEVTSQPVFATGPVAPTAIGLALTGREPGMKKALVAASGGTGETEGAVMLGLRWLANQQNRDGSWSLVGPYTDGSGSENLEAASAMALLAFQGAGYTPEGDSKHPFTPVVRRGWAALLKRMDNDGKFYHDDVASTHRLYTQAQCTIALCELYAMTGDEQYRDAAQKAVDFCVRAQALTGGWKYEPGQTGDMSVTGWMVMALQSARMAGIEVPSPTWELVNQFLESVSRDQGARYAYQERDGATLPLTAEGLLCRQYMGWTRDDPRLNAGVGYLLSNLPSWDKRNVYYWYYATQVCHHMEGEAWQTWNYEMRALLPAHQVRRGREKGSWDPAGDRWGSHGGRLYVTCLSIYILEVYYRHLPLYQAGLMDGTR